jgi:hypothetical protein
MNDLTQYHNVRPMMKTGDLLTYRTRGIVSSLIHIWSADNHAGLVLDLDEYQGEKGRRWTLEALSGGVHTNLLSHVLEGVDGQVFWHQLKSEFNGARPKIMAFMLDQTGATEYDFGSLFKNIFGRVHADLNKLFCSELVFMAWRDAGIVAGEVAPRPSDLAGLGVTMPPILVVDGDPFVIDLNRAIQP